MAAQDGLQKTRIIIRRQSDGEAAAHHGGAWKVAYADFVTAMMAFFLLMWLLNATTEQQRNGLADYFNPSVARMPGSAGDGSERLVKLGVEAEMSDSQKASEFDSVARQVQDVLNGMGAESMQMKNLLKHVVTRMTDEGLVIELTDLTSQPLFVEDSDSPRWVMQDLSTLLAGVLSRVRNDIAISGHVRSYPEALLESPVWALSDSRAHMTRKLMTKAGFDGNRIERVTGYADRRNRTNNPMSPENNRIEVILLR